MEIYGCVPTGCKEKHAGRVQFVVFHLLVDLIAIAVTIAFFVTQLHIHITLFELGFRIA